MLASLSRSRPTVSLPHVRSINALQKLTLPTLAAEGEMPGFLIMILRELVRVGAYSAHCQSSPPAPCRIEGVEQMPFTLLHKVLCTQFTKQHECAERASSQGGQVAV